MLYYILLCLNKIRLVEKRFFMFKEDVSELKLAFEKSNSVDNKTVSTLDYINKQLEKFDLLTHGLDLVFIGTKAAGKSTIINSILGKQFTNETDDNHFIEVLKTGAGATTACPMNIITTNLSNVKIEITPISEEDLEDLFIAFGYNLFRIAEKDMSNLKKYSYDISPEYMNLLRTVTKTKKRKKSKDTLTEKVNVDPGKELAMQYEEADFLEFVEKLKELACLHKRNQNIFICEDTNTAEQASWLKNKINELNSCSNEQALIPQEITLEVPDSLFSFEKLNSINSIRDSRGYDANNSILAREDFVNIFSKEKNNFIIIVEDFDKAPNKQTLDLLRHYAHSEELDIIDRMIFLCNYRSEQPLKVNIGDEPAETIEEGCEERKEQILLAFNQNDIYFKEENIIFFNPNENHEKITGSLLNEETMSELLHQQELIISSINASIDAFISKCNTEIEDLKLQIQDLSNHSINEVSTNILKDLMGFIEDYLQQYPYSSEESLKSIINHDIQSLNPSVLHAFNRRMGYYKDESIFRLISINISAISKNHLIDLKKQIKVKISTHLNNSTLPEDILMRLSQIEKQLLDKIQHGIDQLLQNHNDLLANDVYSPNRTVFWNNCLSRYGQGNGYRNDISIFYQDQLIDYYGNMATNLIVKKYYDELQLNCNNLIVENLTVNLI